MDSSDDEILNIERLTLMFSTNDTIIFIKKNIHALYRKTLFSKTSLKTDDKEPDNLV